MKPIKSIAVAWLIGAAIVLFGMTGVLRAADESADLATAKKNLTDQLNSLEGWLQSRYPKEFGNLQIAKLRSQLNLSQPDPATLNLLLQVWENPNPQMVDAKFQTTKDALIVWLQKITPGETRLPDWILQIAASKSLETPQDVKVIRQQYEQAVKSLDQSLANDKGGLRWRDYLLLKSAQEALQKPSLDLDRLRQILVRWEEAQYVWNIVPILQARTALQQLIRSQYTLDAPVSVDDVLQKLAVALQTPEEEDNSQQREEIRKLTVDLEQRGVAPLATFAVRQIYSQPTLRLLISRAALERSAYQQFDEPFENARDTIVGADVVSNGRFFGKSWLEVVPNDQFGSLKLQLQATSNASSVSNSSGVTVRSRGITQVSASLPIMVQPQGIVFSPASAKANTSISYQGISGGRNASSRVYGMQGQAERESAEHAESLAAERLQNEASKWRTQLAKFYVPRIQAPLIAKDAFPRTMHCSSSPEGLQVLATEADSTEFGCGPGDSSPAGLTADFVVQVHQMFIERLFEKFAVGKAISSRDVESLLHPMSEKTDVKAADSNGQWSMTMRHPNPLKIECERDVIQIYLAVEQFHSEDDDIPGMDIRVQYQAQNGSDGACLIRSGPIEINPQGQDPERRLSGRELVFRKMLLRTFARLFTEQIDLTQAFTDAGLPVEGKYQATNVQSNAGWLSLAYVKKSSTAPHSE